MAKFYTVGSSALKPDAQPGDNPRDKFHVIEGGKSSKPDLQEAEQNALTNQEPSFYRGSGRPDTGRKTGKNRLLVRKKGFIGIILSLSLMIGGAAFLSGTNSLLGPALNDVVTEVTDTQYASASRRMLTLTAYQLNNNAVSSSLTGKLRYNAMSKSFQKRLADNGIKVEGSGSKRTLKFQDETISANDFKKVYNDNIEFQTAYTNAKRGRIMGFFDNIANKVYNKLGLNRNIWNNYEQTADSAKDRQAFNETMTKELDGETDASLRTNYGIEKEETYTYTNAEGKEVEGTRPVLEKHETSSGVANTKANIDASNYLKSVSQNVQKNISWACTAMNVVNMVSISIAATEIYQSIKYAMGLEENPSKMKMGYGSESGINDMLNFMTTSSTTEVEDYANMEGYSGNLENDADVIKLGKLEQTGSPLEAEGMVKIMTGLPISLSTVSNYSLERISNKVSTSVSVFRSCNVAKSSTALVSIAVSLIPGLGQAKIVGSFLSKLIAGSIATLAISAFISFLIPTVTKVLFSNAYETATGIPAGELFAKGISAANGRIGRSASSQAAADEATILTYNKVHEAVLAQEAAMDRYQRSPFDISSKNTFLGSIAYNFGTTVSTGFMGKIKNLMRNTSSSISTILGQAHADSNLSYMMTFGDCPLLDSIYHAKGDMYCNPIPITDPSTIDLSPEDEKYLEVIEKELEPDGEENYKIKKNGNLAKYITYCDNRDSPPGAVDSNILTSLKSTGSSTGDLIIGLAGSIPVAGDILDLIDSGLDESNMGWATYAKCVASSENPDWDSEFKYYQRFIEDQRLLEQMGNYENSQSLVSAFVDEYDTEHPLDNSPSGYLARISGLSKDDAQLVLDIAWYYDFLEDYDANTRIAMDGTASDVLDGETVIAKLDYAFRYRDFSKNFESDTPSSAVIIAEYVIYADIRNRSYAV